MSLCDITGEYHDATDENAEKCYRQNEKSQQPPRK